MTVQNVVTKNRYVGNGTTTLFPYTFDIDDKHPEYIHVYINDGESDKETTNFEVEQNARQIQYPKVGAPLAEGSIIVIAREVPVVQELNLENQGPFFAEDIEQNFDDLVYMIQQLTEQMSRVLMLAITTSTQGVDVVLPYGKDKTFKWNSEGTGFELTEDPAKVLTMVEAMISAFETEIQLQNAAMQRNFDQRVQELTELVGQQVAALEQLYNQLSSATISELNAVAEQTRGYANVAENAAWVNSRWPIGNTKVRTGETYGLENADVTTLPLASKNVKIQVTGDADSSDAESGI